MVPILNFWAVIAAALSILLPTLAHSQPGEAGDRTLSPYFFIKSDDPKIDSMPLKSTSALVNIAGVIADVQVTQVYKNEGQKPLEAIYVFPASTKAAVYGMKMIIGARVIEAKIEKRDQARLLYEQAKNQGKSASLLEQQRPNVFQMSVANIMPGDEIRVDLKYTELLVPTDRVYEFVYPTVVGPRYSNQAAETAPPSERWSQNPYLHQGDAPPYAFDILVNMNAGMPIKDVLSSSHKVSTTWGGPSMAMIQLDPSERNGGNRDFILRYRLSGKQVQSGLLLYEGEKENFFLLMLQPPQRVSKKEIPGREYIFIVDVSGSMHGFPLEISKKLLANLIGNLRPTDRFNVLLFSGGSAVMSEESLPATPENIQRATQLIERQKGGGGTELLPAFRRALALPKAEGFSRTIVIATDGYVTVEEEVFDLIRNNLGDANVFPFGIGTAVNRHIIEGMARVGMGEPFVITKPEEAPAKAEHFRTLIQSPVLTRVKVNSQKFGAYDVEPLHIPDVLAERPVIVFGKWRGKVQGQIILSGLSGNGSYRETIEVRKVKPSKDNSALRYLWARHRITLLVDYNKLRSNDKRIKEVTDLGIGYNLLTAYTSFVAIDSEVRNRTGEASTVKQPLPLPQGVSDYAVGNPAAVGLAYAPRMAKEFKVEALEKKGARDEQLQAKETDKSLIQIEKVNVSEGLSKAAVLQVVQVYLSEMDRCTLDRRLGGRLTIELIINSSGQVKTSKVLFQPNGNLSAERCILEHIQKWQFPATSNGREVKATIIYVFGS